MNDEPELELSILSQELKSGGRTVSVEIYRLEGDEEWALEIVDEFNNSTVWDDTFPTESVVFRILCHFFILCKREMTHDQTNIRHGSRTASSA